MKEKKLYKIRIYTYSNGYYEEKFYAIDNEQAELIANELFFEFDDNWFWNFI